MNKNKPDIRFKGFTDNWEIYKALNIFESYINKNCLNLPILSATQEFGMIKRNETGINISHNKKNEITYKHVLPGQFVIHLRSFQGGFAHSAIEGITSPAYTIFGFKEIDKHYDYFWKYIFNSEKFIKRLEIVTYGIRDGRSINYNQFLMMVFYYPNYKEQKKIGTFFKHLDSFISLYQQKCEKLKNIKRAMLEKMFPKDGDDVPEIRFKGFTDSWKRCQIDELGEVITGSTPSTKVKEYYSEGGIPWVTPTDIVENITFFTAKYLSKKGQKVARIVPKDTILVTSIASIGKNTIIGTLGSFNQQINGLVPNESNPYFLFTESLLWSEKMKRLAAAGTMQIVNKIEFSKIITNIPSSGEQKKIGIFFKHFDSLISLYQQKCKKLKNIKKAMLEKMFI